MGGVSAFIVVDGPAGGDGVRLGLRAAVRVHHLPPLRLRRRADERDSHPHHHQPHAGRRLVEAGNIRTNIHCTQMFGTLNDTGGFQI